MVAGGMKGKKAVLARNQKDQNVPSEKLAPAKTQKELKKPNAAVQEKNTLAAPKKKSFKKNKKPTKATSAAAQKAKFEAHRLDEIEKFLATVDNPDEWRTLRNADGTEKLVLTDQELSLITRLYQNQMGSAEYNPYEPMVRFFTKDVEPMALPAATEPKRRFIPSAHEAREISRLVRAIRSGTRQLPGYKPPSKPRYYDIWADGDDGDLKKRENHISAPKVRLPEHRESYNPPPEYLFTPAEQQAWQIRQDNPDIDEAYNPNDFLPQKYSALRLVPGFINAIKERFARCLDLYLCPRAIKHKLNIDPDSLLPRLPDPRDLRPFPILKSINYSTTSCQAITGLSFDASGSFFVSSQGAEVAVWDVQSGKRLYQRVFGGGEDEKVKSVAWGPMRNVPILAVAHGNSVSLLAPFDSKSKFPGAQAACEFLQQARRDGVADSSDSNWIIKNDNEICIKLAGPCSQVTWHRKGDYFATIILPKSDDSPATALAIHHLSRHATQQPFRRLPSAPIQAAFHPQRPMIMLTSANGSVRAYNLQSGELEKKMKSESSAPLSAALAIHPSGEHVLMAASDGRVTWFDMDYASRPYQQLTGHSGSVNCVAFHPRLPLFASASSDGSVQIAHGQVFQDLMQSPVIVPVKVITGHSNKRGASSRVGVTQCAFHPNMPWILSGTADGSISLFTA